MADASEYARVAALVGRARRGDGRALAALLQEHRTVITSTLFACGVRSRETAADLAQDVAVKVLEQLDGLREARLFRPWLRRIAANAARDHLRRLTARREDELEAALALESDDDPHDVAERTSELRLMLAALGDEDTEVVDLLLSRADGASVSDLAARMDLPVAALKMRLSRARQRLRRRLADLRGSAG